MKLATIPLDTAKVRLQIQGEQTAKKTTSKPYKSAIDCIWRIAREESPKKLFSGSDFEFCIKNLCL